ncbi:MAG: flavin reductase family protein [Desulfarculaceae bacterium]|jgi:flavin reductase (DIM6/NTAB) family NADH-FMN oxidoreductase RutF
MKRSLGANTLLYPTPVVLVGTYDSENRPNLMTAAWCGVCCSKPPLVSVSLRAATYSHGSIKGSQAFTINIPSKSMAGQADYMGMVSGRGQDKFAETGLTPVKSDLVNAPYLEEAPLVLECKLVQTNELGLHTQFIGEILDAKADEDCIGSSGVPDPVKVDPLCFIPGLRAYFGLGQYLGQAYDLGRRFME